jgi:hypothetical protein
MSAIRKLAVEATDNGLLAPELAAGIQRVKSAKSIGVRMGNWLSLKQAQALLNVPDITTTKGLRDRAIIAVLLGCALRRSEVAALTMSHIQQRDGRWCIVDLVGKHNRVRTVPMPAWVKVGDLPPPQQVPVQIRDSNLPWSTVADGSEPDTTSMSSILPAVGIGSLCRAGRGLPHPGSWG